MWRCIFAHVDFVPMETRRPLILAEFQLGSLRLRLELLRVQPRLTSTSTMFLQPWLGLNAPKSIWFSYHTVINIYVFRFRNVKTYWCVNQPESLAQGVSVRAGHRRRRRTFQTHSFIYSLSKLASQCIGKKKGEEKGAFSSGESARGHVSGVICIWMETFSPELKEKIQFITVAWEIPQVQALTPLLFQQPSSR